MVWTAETFSVDDVDVADRLDAWGEICKESLMADFVGPARPSDGAFHGVLTKRSLDDVVHINFVSTPFEGGFSPHSSSAEYIGIGFAASSYLSEQLEFQDGHATTYDGHLTVWECSSLHSFARQSSGSAPVEQTFIMFPRTGVRDMANRLRSRRGVCQPDSNAGHLLAALATSLNDIDHVIEPEAGYAIRNALVELASGTVSSGLEFSHAAVGEAMRRKVESWVRSNLRDGDVSPESAARAHGLSLRSLHRLFSDSDQTYGAFVRSARIERARQDIVASEEPVQRIAMRWGYSDASHFCREFRRLTGLTTSESRAQARTVSRAS